jgi:hypothetical protein
MHKIVWAKFLSGIEVYLLGIAVAAGPDILNYTAGFDFTKLGLSPDMAHAIGGLIMAAKALNQVREKVKPAPVAPGLTGGEAYGNNRANK